MSIRLDGISKTFGAFQALDAIALEAQPGEFLALLGPSGSGKTTLLRIMAGLDSPTEGTVWFDDQDVTGIGVAQRHIGFVFQHYALFKHMTVAENIAFGLTVRKRRDRPARAVIAARVDALLDIVQLKALGKRYPAQLSGGQRQRVALARALAVEPRLLLLDEPFGALDVKVRKDLRRWLRDLHKQMGLTSIFVTHDQEEALELADRVVVMKDGRIEQIASPQEIYENPASAFVFDFVGEGSIVPVDVRDGQLFCLGQAVASAPVPAWSGEGRLCFRPHEVALVEPATGGIDATIVQIRQRNGRAWAEARLSGDHLVELILPDGGACHVDQEIGFVPQRMRVYPA